MALLLTLAVASNLQSPSVRMTSDVLAGPGRLLALADPVSLTTSRRKGTLALSSGEAPLAVPALAPGSGTPLTCGGDSRWVALTGDRANLVVISYQPSSVGDAIFQLAPLEARALGRVVTVVDEGECAVAVLLESGDVATLDVAAWKVRMGRGVTAAFFDAIAFPRGLLFESIHGGFVIGAPDGSLAFWRLSDGTVRRVRLPAVAVPGGVHTDDGGLWFLDRSGRLHHLSDLDSDPRVLVDAYESAPSQTGLVPWKSKEGDVLAWLTDSGRMVTYNGERVFRSRALSDEGFRWPPLVMDLLGVGTLQLVALAQDGTLFIVDRSDLELEEWPSVPIGHRPTGPLIAAQLSGEPSATLSFGAAETRGVWASFAPSMTANLDVEHAVLHPAMMMRSGRPHAFSSPIAPLAPAPASPHRAPLEGAEELSCDTASAEATPGALLALALLTRRRRRASRGDVHVQGPSSHGGHRYPP